MTERKISNSMQNLVDIDAPYMAFMPISLYIRIAKNAGYTGTEYYPYLISSLMLRSFRDLDTNGITSSHESWGSNKILKQIIAMRPKVDSLNDSIILQKKTPGYFPVVVYPHKDHEGESRPKAFDQLKDKIMQPSADEMKFWGLNTTKELIKRAKSEGFRICLDLFHIRRNSTIDGSRMENWRDVIDQTLIYTDEIHLAVGRDDFHGPFNSMGELADIYYGTRKTEIIEMLEFVKDKEREWERTIPIVTEIPARGIARLLSINNKILTPTILSDAHSKIVSNIRNIMA
jgi:hypothetical protein